MSPKNQRPTHALVGMLVLACLCGQRAVASTAAAPPSPALAALLKKNIRITDGSAHFTGKVHWFANKTLQSCHGRIQVKARAVAFPDQGPLQLTLQQFNTTGQLDAARPYGGILALSVTHGITQVSTIGYSWVRARHFLLHWDLANGTIRLTDFTFHALGGIIHGKGNFSPTSRIVELTFTGTGINQASLLAHFSPQHFDIHGPADIVASLKVTLSGDVTGTITASSIKPGTLRMYRIPILGQMLTTTGYSQLDPVLKRMLRAYPYRDESITVTAQAQKTLIHLHFDRSKTIAAKSKTVIITLHGQKMKVRPEIPHIDKTFIAPPVRKLLHLMNLLFSPEQAKDR